MKTFNFGSLISVAALAIGAGTSHGAQPPDQVSSDPTGNTAMGTNALMNLTSGSLNNTAAGEVALARNTTGQFNTAFGNGALEFNSTASFNTAVGSGTLLGNTTGTENTASGYAALGANTTGSNNTASGAFALACNSGGYENTAFGAETLIGGTYNGTYFECPSGGTQDIDNAAFGFAALQNNNGGFDNTAAGAHALYSNTTGWANTAEGGFALGSNQTGTGNVANGAGALNSNTTGSYNIAVGMDAGDNLLTGSYNIDIGNEGKSNDNNIIRIGVEGQQAKTFIAGIYKTSVSGAAVMVNSSGQLGVVVSSERFKTAIAPMGSNSAKLQELRPVTFKLKTDTSGTRQYGLIAEEVAKVYPELVIRDEKGQIDGVRYDELAPMLLNEMQKQERTVDALAKMAAEQAQVNAAQAAQIRDLKHQVAELDDLKREMHAALKQLVSKDRLVAQR
jgi:hypothetical protein